MIRLTAGEFIVLLGDLNKKGSGSKVSCYSHQVCVIHVAN